MRRVLQTGTLVLASVFPMAVAAQVGVAPHVGTLGIGADVGFGLGGPINVRGGANITPFELNLTESNIDYVITFPSPQFTVMLDVSTPVGFRVTGGVLISPDDISGTAEFAARIDINGVLYSSSQVATLEAAIINKEVSPYVGIGWGSPGRSRVGFFMDLGVALQGSPTVAYTVTGPLANDPTLQSNLALEARDLEDELSRFKYYPVISLGLSFGL